MRRLATALAITCLALLAHPDRGAAQQGAYTPSHSPFREIQSSVSVLCDAQGSYVPASCAPSKYPSMMGEGFLAGDCGPRLSGCSDSLCGEARFWSSFDLLFGYQKSRQLPPLVTTSPAGPPPTPQTEAGVLGLPTTTMLFGGDRVENNPQLGVRGELGVWLRKSGGRQGIGVSFLYLPEDEVAFSGSSNGSMILARPFFNTLTNQQASQLVAYPGFVSGSVDVRSGTDIYAGEVFLRHQIGACPMTPRIFLMTSELGMCARHIFNLPGMQRVPGLQRIGSAACNVLSSSPQTRLDLITGYQFNRLNDRLSVTNNLVSPDSDFLGQIGTTLDAFDRFDTSNEFHGGTLGLKSVSRYGCWTLAMLGKVGLGSMDQQVTIDGQTTITHPEEPSSTRAGGLLAQPSNIGSFDRRCFTVVPEVQISLSYDLTCRLKMGAGYQFTYWDSVTLAGDQVFMQVDITQTFANPSFTLRESDFFVQAASLFLQWNY